MLRFAPVGLCLLLLALAAAPPASAATTVTLPRWQVGDEWTYRIELVDAGQLVQTGEKRVVVTARGPYAYGGGTREAVTFTTWHNMSGDPPASWSDVRDAATGALLATQGGQEPLVAKAPCEDLRFPLEYPMGWTESCDLGFGPVETRHSVAGGETLTLPAGTFDALTVDSVGNDAVRRWHAQEACGKIAEFSQVNEQQTWVNLTRVECASAPAATTTTTTSTPPTGATTTTRTTTTTTTTSTPPTGAGGESMPFPDLTRGDRWIYTAEIAAGGRTYHVNSTIQAQEARDFQLPDGRTVKSQGVLRDDSLYPTAARTGSELAILRSIVTLTPAGEVLMEDQHEPTAEVEGLAVPQLTFRYDAPCRQIDWPLAPGKSWSVRCPGTATIAGTNLTFELTGTGRVDAVRRETVPEGTFDVFPVVMDLRYGGFLSRSQTVLFSKDVCWFVSAKPGLLTTEDKLTDFSCKSTGLGEGSRGSETPGPGAALVLAGAAAAAVLVAARKRS